MSIENSDQGAAEVLLSVDDDVPLEEGGPAARKGFNYQDEVCASLFLRMLRDEALIKIHCETHDDHVLIWRVGEGKVAEYVQVKAGEPDKLWSVADLCKVDSESGSLFQKSLKNDCHTEDSLFRIVTLRDVVGDLKPLTFPPGSAGREPDCSEVLALVKKIHDRFPEFKSKKKNGAAFWVDKCIWEVCPSEADLAKSNSYEAISLAHDEGRIIHADQARLLLDDLRLIAKKSGAARWKPDKSKKIITRDWLRAWWDARLIALLDNVPAGGKLAEKLADVGAPDDMVASAIDQRRRYAAAIRTSKYMSDDDAEALQSSIRTAILRLRSGFVAGEFEATPLQFLNLCLGQVRLAAASAPIGVKFPTEEFAYGCMFDIADRCLLRFTAPES